MKAPKLASLVCPRVVTGCVGLAELPGSPVSHELVMIWIKPQVCHLKNGDDLRDLLVRVMVRGLNEMVQEVHLAQYLCECSGSFSLVPLVHHSFWPLKPLSQ